MENKPNIKRWSGTKLDKELAFARAAIDINYPETLFWLVDLLKEDLRRHTIAIKSKAIP